ncbi:alpha amylase C-terminal domain-containing protein, partial [Vibrio fluvialis]
LGVPKTGSYQLLLNSDAPQYDGSGFEVNTLVATEKVPSEGLPHSLRLRVPPLATLMYKFID